MQLILSIYHVICSVTSKINIKNSAKFNIRSTSRLTYDIIRQLHLPQNGYFMERSNFLVAIIRLILRSLAIIPGWFVSLGHETPASTSLSRSTSGVTSYKPQTRKHISWWELCSAWWRVNTYFHHAHWVILQIFPCLYSK